MIQTMYIIVIIIIIIFEYIGFGMYYRKLHSAN